MLWGTAGCELLEPGGQQEKVPREGPCAGLEKALQHQQQLGQGTLANILSPSSCPSQPCSPCYLPVLGQEVVCGSKRRSQGGFAPCPGPQHSGEEWGQCLSQACKRIRGFQMQIIRLGCVTGTGQPCGDGQPPARAALGQGHSRAGAQAGSHWYLGCLSCVILTVLGNKAADRD